MNHVDRHGLSDGVVDFITASSALHYFHDSVVVNPLYHHHHHHQHQQFHLKQSGLLAHKLLTQKLPVKQANYRDCADVL